MQSEGILYSLRPFRMTKNTLRSQRFNLTREIMYLYITGFGGSGHQAQA